MARFLLIVLVFLGCGACSNTSSSRGANASPGTPVVVTFRDYRSHLRLAIVNDGFLAARGLEGATASERRVNYYSTPGVDLMVKATSDRLVDGLLEFLDDQGFSQHATDGPAPPENVSNAQLTTSLEVIIDGRPRTWLFDVGWSRSASPPRAMRSYADARNVFLEAHRQIEQYATGGIDDWNFGGAQVTGKGSF
jgi:hypothetical protein